MDFKYEITEHIADLSEENKGWKKELNMVSWNGRESKYDIRSWYGDYEKMGKGISLNKEEFYNLIQAAEGRV